MNLDEQRKQAAAARAMDKRLQARELRDRATALDAGAAVIERAWGIDLSHHAGSNLSDLYAAGDSMQSSLSRILTALLDYPQARALGYETQMAALEGKNAVEAWTEARRKA